MFHITILALGAIIASNAFADHQAINGDAGPVGTNGTGCGLD
jgi:hypothetical protein